jgi:serine/threonine-protein kinase
MSEPTERLEAAFGGQYKILHRLGEGGMATVYLAEDLKHERQVALKVLKPELAAVLGGERFLTEIKTTASLQHPHILPLFDSGEADSFLYYVMPYIDGDSLRDRLDHEKQLPVDEAIKIARAVADALDYAHRKDIIHRDIKPENILLHDGNPVVADFGIALAVSAAGGGRMTETGLSLGTPHYMSPEQATADRDLSTRSDVYSLACVLYEMLTGDPPHVGPTPQSILMRILTEEPRSVTEIRRSVPPHVAAALAKGLEKLPADRFDSAAAFRDALEDPAFTYQAKTVAAPAVKAVAEARPARGFDWKLTGALAFGAIMTVIAFTGGGEAPPVGPAISLTLELAEAELFQLDRVVVSRDGRRFAYSGTTEEGLAIHQRAADAGPFQVIPGTEGGAFPSFSPDGQWIAYALPPDRGIFRVAVSGGAPRPLVPSGQGVFSPQWTSEGTVIFTDGQTGVFEVPEAGGEAQLVFSHEEPVFQPQMLPERRGILGTGVSAESTIVYDFEADSVRTLIPNGTAARYIPTGHVLYVDGSGRLWASAFDLDALELVGDPVPILDGVATSQGLAIQLDVSDSGTLVYGAGEASNLLDDQELLIVPFDGEMQEVPIDRRLYRQVRWSPEGTTIAFSAIETDDLENVASLYVYDVALRTATRQITFDHLQGWPIWSPDGRRIVFSGTRPDGSGTGVDANDQLDLWVKAVYDDSDPVHLLEMEGPQYAYAWTADDEIVFTSGEATSSDLLLARLGDPVETRTYLNIDADLGASDVSPDGRHIAMASNESGSFEIVVRSFPEPRQPVRISNGGGDRPRWGPDGRSIYYWKRDDVDTLMVARVQTEPVVQVLSEEVVFVDDSGDYSVGTWDLHPDGDRIIIARVPDDGSPTEERAVARQVVVVNWFEELRAAFRDGNE